MVAYIREYGEWCHKTPMFVSVVVLVKLSFSSATSYGRG